MAVTIRIQTGLASLDAHVRSFYHFLLLIFSEVVHLFHYQIVSSSHYLVFVLYLTTRY